MKSLYTPRFRKDLKQFPTDIQRKFAKQHDYLLLDLKHPSLRAKKYDAQQDIWQARVDRDVRFYFRIVNDTYILLEIKHHPK